MSIGANAVVDHVVSGGHLRVKRYGAVFGIAASRHRVDREQQAPVEDARSDLVVPDHSLDWAIAVPSHGMNLTTSWGETVHLAPGSYASVRVAAGAQLVLASGRYQFEELIVEEEGTLVLEAGESELHVASSLQHRGETRANETRLVLGYFGPNQRRSRLHSPERWSLHVPS